MNILNSFDMRLAFVILILIKVNSIFSQPAIQWQKVIGGNKENQVLSVRKTPNGGMIFGGRSTSDISFDKTDSCRGLMDYWIVKTDSSGTIEWQKTIGGSDDDYLFALERTNDGYILGGESISPISGDKTESCRSPGYWDYWIIKIDFSGNIMWQKTIGGNNDDYLRCIKPTSDHGYIVGGHSNSDASGEKSTNNWGGVDMWVLKLDSAGNIQWQKTIGGTSGDALSSLLQSSDGGYLLGGSSISDISGDKTENSISVSYDYWIVKLNSSGVIQWQNTIGGNGMDELTSVLETGGGGFLLSGSSDSDSSGDKSENSHGLNDIWLVKVNSLGTIQWQKTYGGNKYDYTYGMIEDAVDGYLIYGFSDSDISGQKSEQSRGIKDCWVIKIDSQGNFLWDKTIGGSGSDELRSITITDQQDYIFACSSSSVISGDKTEDKKGSTDYWLIKLKGSNPFINEIESAANIYLYPNPVSSELTIDFPDQNFVELKILDMLGQVKMSFQKVTAGSRIRLDNLSMGVYYLMFENENKILGIKKIIKL